MAVFAVIVAGGSGLRAGGEIPKQFQRIHGKLVLEYSLSTLAAWKEITGLLVACHGNYAESIRELFEQKEYGRLETQVVNGGNSRHASTLAGLSALREWQLRPDDIIFIHDAARPIITQDECNRLLGLFQKSECLVASLASPVTDTVFQADSLPGQIVMAHNRDELFAIKTPQALRCSALNQLLAAPAFDYTDLLTWAMAAGLKGYLEKAGENNHKITTPEDLVWLETQLQQK